MTLSAVVSRNRTLRAFHQRSYLLVWIGAFISNIGTWMETIAVGVHVTESTGKAGWTGTIAALTFLPATVAGPIGGALADKFERRRYLQVVTAAQMVVAATLALLAYLDRLPMWGIAILMLLTGTLSSLLTPAWNALLADIVPPEDLLSALSLSSAQFNLARVIGPALAAATIAVGGAKSAFTLNAVSFIAVLWALWGVVLPPHERDAHPEALWQGMKSGFRYARADGGIRTSLLLVFGVSVCVSPFIGLIPAMAIKVFNQGAGATSLLTTFQGVGAVLAAVMASAVADRFGRRGLYEGAAMLVGPLCVFYWLSPSFGVACLLIFALGAAYMAFMAAANTTMQARAPRRYQARVSSFHNMVLGGGYSLGLVAQGWLGDALGLRLVPVCFAAVFFAAVAGARVRRRDAFEALEAPLLPSDSGPHTMVPERAPFVDLMG